MIPPSMARRNNGRGPGPRAGGAGTEPARLGVIMRALSFAWAFFVQGRQVHLGPSAGGPDDGLPGPPDPAPLRSGRDSPSLEEYSY